MSRPGVQGGGQVRDVAAASIESSLAGTQTPTMEPVIAQSDEVIRQLIMDASVEYEYVELPNKQYVKRIKKILHPDLYSWIMLAGPLDSTAYYDRDQAMIVFLRRKQLIRKAKFRYRNKNPRVYDMLCKIEEIVYRQTRGDSELGKRQDFVAKIAGADKIIQLLRGESGKKGWRPF